jgi:hypothetical protein
MILRKVEIVDLRIACGAIHYQPLSIDVANSN